MTKNEDTFLEGCPRVLILSSLRPRTPSLTLQWRTTRLTRMTKQRQLLFRARCPYCLRVLALRSTGEIQSHRPCGPNVRPAPTMPGIELDGWPFPEDVTEVVNVNGKRLHRTPEGWAASNNTLPDGRRYPLPDFGPYLVTAVEPRP